MFKGQITLSHKKIFYPAVLCQQNILHYPVNNIIHPLQIVRETQVEERVNLQWVSRTPSHLMLTWIGCDNSGPVSLYLLCKVIY